MSQSVLVFPPARAVALRAFLESRGFVPREAQNALFAATGEGLTITLYRTGKLLVQGPSAQAFAAEKLAAFASGGDGAAADAAATPRAKKTSAVSKAKPKKRAPAGETKTKPKKKPETQDEASQGIVAASAADDARKATGGGLIGTDEAGKGDYFGPLCVAGVVLDAEGEDRLRSMGVCDSKVLADPTVLSLDGLIRAEYPFAVVALEPVDYNRRYAAVRNLNTLLTTLHVDVLETLAARTGCARALTDQFAHASLLLREVGRRGLALDLRQRPRAEEETAVAAASIVARAEFLRRLEALGSVAGRRLPKGASNEVDNAARDLFRRGGREALERVAKMHFKTTDKVTGLFR
jgi:ribonuclease HIII